MMQHRHYHDSRWIVVLTSLFTVLVQAEEAGIPKLLLDNTNADAGKHHVPSSTLGAAEFAEDDDQDDVLPALFAYLLALLLFCTSILLYGILLVWGHSLEYEKEDAALKASAATEEEQKLALKKSSRRWSSFLERPMTPMERFVIGHHTVVRNFILSALVFFAIPNLVILGGMQHDFEVTLWGVLMGIAGCLTVSIVIKVLHGAHQQTSGENVTNAAFSPYNIFVANNKYEHFGLPFLEVIVMGLGQLTLLALYAWGLYEGGPPDFSDPRQYLYYILGILMQIAYGYDKKIWNTIQCHIKFWTAAFRADWLDLKCEYVSNDQTNHKFQMKRDKFVYVRFILSTVINTMGMFVIMMGLPIQVATERDPLGFVLDVVAAFYIVEWDDLGDIEHAEFKCIIYSTTTLTPAAGLPAIKVEPSSAKTELSDTRKTDKDDDNEENHNAATLFDLVADDLGLMHSTDSLEVRWESIDNNSNQDPASNRNSNMKYFEQEVELLKASNKQKDEDIAQLKDEVKYLKSIVEQVMKTVNENQSRPLDEAQGTSS